ncbi:MAG TPA: DASS family sodium-coupled anion symporter [Propioniciclava sp.]|uniref:DASS family sodium-coupled anion symporter n=1 Tax=Propioniciclava sp. TaxID=2038686 RepID=UPI002C80835C|nr:DASS family sodium-coupled anion symporter [Propioniciclava sp.]HRL49379.1 DASS family sodium-coupled anion symporter [Propioniciclava sp.]HRL79922.1 DASS family sodium-coupled anion symporter [Propioniciclava sp.]
MTTDTVAPTASTPPASPAGGNKVKSARRRLIELVGCIALVGILVLLGPPAGLSSAAWTVFALYLGAMAGLMLRPVPEPVVFLLAIGGAGVALSGSKEVGLGDLLAGYADPTAWLVFSAFFIGTAFAVTGLGKRIAYLLIKALGNTPLKLGGVACLTDLILAPATPSNAVRTGGITYPIMRNIAAALDSDPGPQGKRIGRYLTMVTYYASFATSTLFLTAIAFLPLTVRVIREGFGLPAVTWMDYATWAFAPGIVMLAIVPLAVYLMERPTLTHIDNKSIARSGLDELGPMSRREKWLLVLFIAAILGWALGSFAGINANAIAILFVALLLVTGVIDWSDMLNTTSAWTTFIWYGGVIGVIGALSKTGFFTWLGEFIHTYINLSGWPWPSVMIVLVLVVIACRYLFASGVVYAGTVLPILVAIAAAAGVPPYPALMLLAMVSIYGGQVTHYSGTLSPVLFGVGYVSQNKWWAMSLAMALIWAVISFVVGVPWWGLLGLF